MNAYGLTGNIGCGKSTVARLLSGFSDVLILDCDRIAKGIIASGTVEQEINTILEANVFPDRKVDFPAIAKIIFGEPEKKRLLEALIHPLVWRAVEEEVDVSGDETLCIVESAIMYETGSADKFAAVIVVTCAGDEQLRRLRENRSMSDLEIQARLDQQLPSSEKEKRAQFVLRTDGNLDDLKVRVNDLYHDLKKLKGVSK